MTGHPIRRAVAVLAAAALTATLAGNTLAADPEVAAKKKVKCDGKVATKVGTAGNDVIRGTAKRDVIAGLGGNDIIIGGGGGDTICGGAGNDKLVGNAGNDKLIGQAGRDRLFGGSGIDRLFGGSQNDFLAGQTGPDVLGGGPGSDRLDGGIGVDLCSQGTGHGPMVRCELPKALFAPPAAPPPPAPDPMDLTNVLAIAYSEIDGRPGPTSDDALIAKLVDADLDGKPSKDDTVKMGRYPTSRAAATFAQWRVLSHTVASIEDSGATSIAVVNTSGWIQRWNDMAEAELYLEYQDAPASEETRFQDGRTGTYNDTIHTHMSTTSQPSTSVEDHLPAGNAADDDFIDVEIFYSGGSIL